MHVCVLMCVCVNVCVCTCYAFAVRVIVVLLCCPLNSKGYCTTVAVLQKIKSAMIMYSHKRLQKPLTRRETLCPGAKSLPWMSECYRDFAIQQLVHQQQQLLLVNT